MNYTLKIKKKAEVSQTLIVIILVIVIILIAMGFVLTRLTSFRQILGMG